MIFSWEFSKPLESIIFRSISICVEKLNYIKNYIKTRRETRKEGLSSPHFVLRNKTQHLNYTKRRRSAKYERFIKIFLKRDQDGLKWNFSVKIKTTLFSSFRFFFLFINCLPRTPFSARLPSFLLCWKNLDQFLLWQSFVHHPTRTVKNWKFLFQKTRKHSQDIWK